MSRKLIPLVVSMLAWAVAVPAEPPSPTSLEIIEKSIAYHDPNGFWGNGRAQITVHTIYSDEYMQEFEAEPADLVITMAPADEEFRYVKETGGDSFEIAIVKGEGTTLINGSAMFPETEKKRLRVRDPEVYRNYCEYIYGMPMKLKDPGAIIGDGVKKTTFHDREVLQIRVTYDPEVGSDTWYFYFDPSNYALVGYRFYHDEAKNDGEHITFDGEIVDEKSGLRLPRTRTWYYNDGDGYLATDDITALETP